MSRPHRIRAMLRALAARLPSYVDRAAVQPLQELTIVAASRTGSNHLCGVLGSFSNFLILHEIFNESRAYGLSFRDYLLPQFSSLIGQSVAGEEDGKLINFVRQDPQRAIAILARLAAAKREKVLGYKISPGQVSNSVVEDLFTHRRPAVIFVVRGRLASYISALKARLSGRWTNYDSSGIAVEVTIDDFLAWTAARDGWYSEMSAAVEAAGLRHLTLSYERHIDRSAPELSILLARALPGLGIGILHDFARPMRSGYNKQDTTAALFQRVGNGAALAEALRRDGKLDYALGSPMADTVWPAG